MRTQRLIFTFLSGLLLISFSGCSGGRAGGDSRKSGGDSSKSGENLAPSAAWLDNYSPRTCAVTADGESKGTLEPFASLHLRIAPGTHTFVLTCEGQPAETLKADIPPGKNALVRPAASGDYQLLTCTYTATGPSAVRGDVRQTPAPRTGVIIADYGPREEFPDTLKVDEGFVGSPNEGAKTATRTRLIRSLPADPELAELEHFIFCDYRIYGISESPSQRDSVIDRIKRLEPRKEDPAVGDLLIRVLDRLAVCAAGNSGTVAISDAVLRLLPTQQERLSDDRLMAWLGIDRQTGKARVLPEEQRINPSIAATAVSLLMQRGKQQQVSDCFLVLPEDAARALLVKLAHPPAPEELRRRVVVLGLRRPVKGILNEACAALADKDFLPDEEMVEALTATIDQLNPDEGDNRATIKHCSSCLVDAFYRHPAVVARPKTRRFLVRFAHPQLEPTLENARYALIDGRCANDIVPIYIHYTRDVRIEMIGYLVTASKKREAVSQDVIELYRASLADEDTEVRVAAAKALPQLAASMTQDNLSAFQDLLVRALSDPSFDVHHEAARALEVNGFVPNEQIANQLVSAWRQLDKGDPQGQANRDHLAKALKTSFEKNPGTEADKSWRERALAAFAQP